MNNESDYDVHGHCHEWAYSNWKDGDNFFVVTEYDEDIDGYALVHCGLYRDGKYIDARGSFDTLDDVLDVFDLGVDVDNEILTKNEFEEFCNDYGLSLPLNEHTKITLTIKQIRQQKGNNNMGTINENTKLTLTVSQIKKLIRESEDERVVRQISIDIIPDGTYSDGEILHAVEEALLNVDCEVVGGPDFTDASWSEEEYGR